MHKIEITGYRYADRIENLGRILNGQVTEDCDEYSAQFDNNYGKGVIKGINFDHGVGVMMFDFQPNEDIQLVFKLGRRHPIQFQYISKGELLLNSYDDKITHELTANQAMIYAPLGHTDYSMTIKSGTPFQAIIVDSIRFLFLRKIECDLDTIPEILRDMFKDTVGKKAFYHQSTSEPIIVSTLADLFKSKQKGLERKLLIEANSLKLITSLMKRYRVETLQTGKNYRFSKRDIELVNQAKNIIMDRYSTPPTVRELSQVVGLNTSKLQQGFNMLFDKSIRQFTITLRMLQARKMLDEGDYTISEIAYSVGYTNKGHFSKLFQKEFGLLPSQYQQRIPLRARQR